MIPFLLISRKCKIIYSDREQIAGCLELTARLNERKLVKGDECVRFLIVVIVSNICI